MLAGRYWRAPFGSVRANYPDDSGIPEVQVTNPSGGILGGDRLEMDVTLAPGSAATILTQAANKVYRRAAARQNATFRVEESSLLEYLPHHLILFARSSYRQETKIHLAADATLVAWDAVSAGRVARGERFAFDGLSARIRIFRENLPEVVDGFDLYAGGEPFGGYSYVGAAYVLAPRDLEPLAEKLHGMLVRVPRAFASASAPAQGLCAVRVLARDATALYRALNVFRTVTRAYVDLPSAAREIS
jgi:urease accessory protein